MGAASVGEFDYFVAIEPDVELRAFAAYPNFVPLVPLDSPPRCRADSTPATTVFITSLDRVPGITPSAEIAPVEIIFVLNPKQNQETFLAAGFFGFEAVLIISPVRIAECQPYIRAHTFLSDCLAANRPLPQLILLEATVPDQFAPKTTVDRMEDVFEEMAVYLIINFRDYAVRVNGKLDALCRR